MDNIEGPDPSSIELQTNAEAVFNLLNNCLGTGVLTVAFSFTRVGLLGGILGLVISALMNRFTLLLLVKCCHIASCEVAAGTLGRVCFGTPGRVIVVISYASLCVGVLIAYTNAMKDGISKLLFLVDVHMEPGLMALLVFCVVVPVTFTRSMKKVAIVSMAAFVGAVAAIVAIVSRSGLDIAQGKTGEGFKMLDVDPWLVCAAMPLLTMVMSAQSGGPVIFASLADASEENMSRVSWQMYAIVLTMNTTLASAVYLRFGSATKGNVIDSLGDFDPCGVVARLGIVVLAALSYIFIIFPARVALIDLLFQKNEAKQQATYFQFALVTMMLNFFCQGVAYCITDISLIVGIVGAVSSNMIGFILPPLFYIVVRRNPRDCKTAPVPVISGANIPYMALSCFGTLSLCLCLYSTLKNAR